MRTLYPSSFKQQRIRTSGSKPPERASNRWFSREYLSSVWAKRPAKLLALMCFVGIATLLIYVFAAGSESNTLPLSGGTTNNTTVGGDGKVRLNTAGVSTAYAWHKGGYDGGGRGNAAAIDPLGSGRAALGGDVWGAHTTDNYGNEWVPRMWGADGIGQIYMRAVAYSLKNPGTSYWGIGTLKGGGGYFGTQPAGTFKLLKTNTNFGFATTQASGSAGLTPRAVGKLILVDCDSPCSANTEYIYGLSSKGIGRSTDGGKNFSILGGASAPDGAWKSIEKAPDGSLYAVNYGMRSGDTNAAGQQMYHITNPRTTATVTAVSGLPTPINDFATINGTLWAACARGVYKLSGSTWQPVAASTFGITGLTISSIDGTGNTIFVSAGNTPAGSQKWVAKSTDGGSSWNWVTSGSAVSPNVQGTNRPFWLASKSMPGDAFGVEQLVVDHNNANFILMSTFRGAYASTDGGAHWAASVNGLDGTEVSNIKLGVSGEAWNNDTDWGGSGKPWCTIHTTDHYGSVAGSSTCVSFGGSAKSRTVGGVTYTVSFNGGSYDITAGGQSIADDYFRGAVVNPTDMQIDASGFIYVAQFGGGVLVGTPPGH